MDVAVRQQLAAAAQDVRLREILAFLYRDHPQGASFEGLKEMLFLHEDFKEDQLQQLAGDNILVVADGRYKISPAARQVLDRDPVILMDEFLR
ncbi:MAG: hypothetical protein HY598_04105 [Candidatus Omnitrophica bacterium]|nr:hypothetical protein [Candidatus Omnitrophota bacterium]